jgi:alpha-L-fucosidase
VQPFGDERDWFCDARFGLFLHWGLYAIEGWHEQDQMRRRIPRPQYEKLAEQFNPTAFDPDCWLDLAERVGMRYMCFTAKHHDGFCMWDTACSDFKITNTPYGRDILADLADACHRRDMPLCLYYSVADWHHPNYPNRGQSHELDGPQDGDQPDLPVYIEYLTNQVRELCTRYGKIHGIWWDMNQTDHQEDDSIHTMIHQLQPAAVINNRGFGEGDFGTPERDWDESTRNHKTFARPTEACNSIGEESWGYRRDEDYYTVEYLCREIDRVLARGGNYLLNVGPDASGQIPHRAVSRLDAIGDWYQRVRDSYQAELADGLADDPRLLLTRRDNTLFVHLTERPITASAKLWPFAQTPRRATLLNDGRPVEFEVSTQPRQYNGQQLKLHNLPIEEFCDEVIVVRLDLQDSSRG